ncbi:flagellar hook-associated protein FlgK [Butyrivibrio sp. YAB3001]|uniref:flagellar hook-associated protein FlgK n=1 Tax=Butyrivibrio sp. YAB3001 TaxID=1520812 RepID=UPI0008F65CD5|nr:flagellar basal body rod C-terminal domain-containing protein [Butyrivibrio sp. YAB3001]SFB95616.1 flagellar hook-associated protein 1 FlgK [Butyrivibrio sp. YAB3001]
MPSQFFGLNIAASGLRAANASLNTTANNISNADTKGYSRQKVKQEASDPIRVFARYGCAGAGVETIAIERVRDNFYDVKYRTNESLLGNVQQKNYYNQLIEQYLADDGTTGFTSLFDKMKVAMEDVKKAAGTTEAKATFVSSMRSLTEYFNSVYTSLQNEQADVNAEIKLCADRITAISQEVASINKQINVIEMTGTTANELRDKRDVLIDELSKIVSVEVKESPVKDENDPDRVTGATRYQVWIGGSYQLVDSYEYRKLVCVARESDGGVNQNDVDGLFELKWAYANYKDGDDYSDLSDFQMDSRIIGGELQGLLAIRDGNNSQYFHGISGTPQLIPVLDANGNQEVDTSGNPVYERDGNGNLIYTVEIDVGDVAYLKDMNKCTIPQAGQITIGSKMYKYDSWSYDGGSKYKFVLDNGGEPSDYVRKSVPATGKAASIGFGNSYEGIPYYLEQMNEWIRQFSSAVNDIMVSGYTSDSLDGVFLLTGVQDRNSVAQYSYEELTSLSENKGYYFLRGGNFDVNSVLQDNCDRLATKSDITEGESEYHNMDRLKEMFDTKKIFRGATSGEFLTKVLADVALNTSNANTLEETYTALEKTIGNQRLSDSGVDEDEEASNLVKFQNAYTLSSKMIQTLTEIYDRLILETGV